jgi:hypothetical protein
MDAGAMMLDHSSQDRHFIRRLSELTISIAILSKGSIHEAARPRLGGGR